MDLLVPARDLIRRDAETGKDGRRITREGRHAEGSLPHEDRGRDYSDVAASPRFPSLGRP